MKSERIVKMNGKTIGFLFPAFGKGYKKFHGDQLPEYNRRLDAYLASASKLINIDERQFKNASNGIIEDDLQAHYACYINSCVLSDILEEKHIQSDFVGPFSMGLYAALYHVSSVSFEEGLYFMHHQLQAALRALNNDMYAMASVVGLTQKELQAIIDEIKVDVELVDTIADLVHVLAGKKSAVVIALQMAQNKGSQHTRLLPVRLPYHSSFMQKIQFEIHNLLNDIQIQTPKYPLISTINQKTLTTAEDVRNEMSRNIFQRVNWSKTLKSMLNMGVTSFVECGPSKDLSKLVKLSQRGISTYHPNIYNRLFKDILLDRAGSGRAKAVCFHTVN